jgi:GT2 family glycosyltransferase
MKIGRLPQSKLAVVAIPAHNEACYIADCLAALALQRDEFGAPIEQGSLEILVFANNCTDETATVVRQAATSSPHLISVIEEDMPPSQRNAGWARKRAMDLAANRLAELAPIHGLILTTDADSRVSPTWLAAIFREFKKDVDCVAGYIDAIPTEYVALGGQFLARGRLEDSYLRYLAEINARCDPLPHDPWPNHRVSSGASLAITLPAYSAIGGLPPRAVGEDAALTETLARAGFKVRHSMDVSVSTSCRFEGRAAGGAADTMRHRHAVPNAACDEELESALQATRRALYRGILRKRWMNVPAARAWPAVLAESAITAMFDGERTCSFEEAWDAFCDRSPAMKRGKPLRPSDLPRQIAIARMIVQQLQLPARSRKIAQGDRLRPEEPTELALSV